MSRMVARWLALMLMVTLLATASGSARAYPWWVYPPYPVAQDRFGVGGVPSQRYSPENLETLGAAWYVNWGVSPYPPHPAGMGALQILRVEAGVPELDRSAISAAIQANPGDIWRIGNEPDSIWMDNCTPTQYAQVYHELYHIVKAEDPTAKVAFGGLVQATPLRLFYLDQVWQAYQTFYGTDMPVDVWTIHSFILPEVPDSWGAEIPPGIEAYAHLGIPYEMRDHDDMGIFIQRFIDFRQWMADHGQRDKPLLVPEYGILLWPEMMDEDGNDFDNDRVITFMYATFDFFLSRTDPDIGYPADGDRLVQAWAWYSLDDNVYYEGQKIGDGYGGDLFTGPYTKTLTPLGEAYAAYVQSVREPDYTDLWPVRLDFDPASVVWETGGSASMVTVTLTAEIANLGRQPASNVEVQFWEGEPGPSGTVVLPTYVVPEIPGRYEGVGLASAQWIVPAPGEYTFWVVVDPNDSVIEPDEGNNRRSGRVVVMAMTARLYLPVLMR